MLYHRVPFIEKPWYDDHFDVPTERQRIGKTLAVMAGLRASSDLLSRGSLLVGWALYEKLDVVISLMTEWTDAGAPSPAVTEAMVCTTVVVIKFVDRELVTCSFNSFVFESVQILAKF